MTYCNYIEPTENESKSILVSKLIIFYSAFLQQTVPQYIKNASLSKYGHAAMLPKFEQHLFELLRHYDSEQQQALIELDEDMAKQLNDFFMTAVQR